MWFMKKSHTHELIFFSAFESYVKTSNFGKPHHIFVSLRKEKRVKMLFTLESDNIKAATPQIFS